MILSIENHKIQALVESQLARAWNAEWLCRGANQGKSVTGGSG